MSKNIEQTLSIIKPDAVFRNCIGGVYSRIEEIGLKVVAAKMMQLNQQQAASLYALHKDRPFYDELLRSMTAGPVMVQVLEGKGAILKYRKLMGATMPKDAQPGTIRHDLVNRQHNNNGCENVVHGSDSPESARTEINFFFSSEEIYPRVR